MRIECMATCGPRVMRIGPIELPNDMRTFTIMESTEYSWSAKSRFDPSIEPILHTFRIRGVGACIWLEPCTCKGHP